MEEKKEDFISYVDDDGEIKNQWVEIIEESFSGVKFKLSKGESVIIFIPWHHINKIKRKDDEKE